MKQFSLMLGTVILLTFFLWGCANPLSNTAGQSIGSPDLNSKIVNSDQTTPIVPPVLPKLLLKVIAADAGSPTTDKTNVTYIATLAPSPVLDTSADSVNPPIKLVKIDFYTGDPAGTIFPGKYLGSAFMGANGQAVLKIYQEPGQYAGGAVWVTSDKKILSNVVIYQVPKPIIPTLSLKVLVNPASADVAVKANVTFTAQVNMITPLADTTDSLPVNIMIDFYTGDPTSTVFPGEYLGSAPLNKQYIAVLAVLQKPGQYAGGAVWAMSPWGKLISNVVYYAIPEQVKPSINLEVKVADNAVDSLYNVIFSAKLINAITPTSAPIVLDFYTGNPLLDVYPNQYLGSAKVDSNGLAVLMTNQKPGKYAGGAIWAQSPWGEIFSNVVFYDVPGIVNITL